MIGDDVGKRNMRWFSPRMKNDHRTSITFRPDDANGPGRRWKRGRSRRQMLSRRPPANDISSSDAGGRAIASNVGH
jgi:hypothetical protein